MADVVGVLQLPGDVEGYVDGWAADGQRGGYVALQRVAHHEQLGGLDAQAGAELAELGLALVAGYLSVVEVVLEPAALQLVLLVEQLALGEDDEPVGGVLPEPLKGMLHAGQRGAGKLHERIAVLQQLAEGLSGHGALTHAHGRLEDGEGEGLHAVTQQPHVLALGGEELEGRRLAVCPGNKLVVEPLHDALEMALAVPERVVGVEGYYFKRMGIHYGVQNYAESLAKGRGKC